MRSIRHPHLLTFFGAGVDKKSRAFLVTEIMQWSLKPLLRDATRELDWATRLSFASDIAKGMRSVTPVAVVTHSHLRAALSCLPVS